MERTSMDNGWPDDLKRTEPARVAVVLAEFWRVLGRLPGLIGAGEQLLAAECTAELRRCVLELMLALNGIAYPAGTQGLNRYLSASQRAAIERTLAAPSVDGDAWLGQAVALVVIYRWYAPQLEAAYALAHPAALEAETLALLQNNLADWPLSISTD